MAAHDYIMQHHPTMNLEQICPLQNDTLHAWEIVDSAAHLGVMNLYLHGIGGDSPSIKVDDKLRSPPPASTTTWC